MSYVKPDQLIDSIVHSGVVKAELTVGQMFARGGLSGAILACATTVAYTASQQTGLPIVGAIIFPVGFVVILLLGLELVTGSFALIPLAVLEGRTTVGKMLKNFGVVLTAHLIGACFYAAMYWAVLTQMGTEHDNPLIKTIIEMAEHKTLAYSAIGASGIVLVFIKAVLCNWMIALGTIMFYTSTGTAGKIMAMWLPVTSFFALGFEHGVVNMYVIPQAMMLGAPISWGDWLGWNEFPVIIGNFVGAVTLTAALVYFSHRTKINHAAAVAPAASIDAR